MTVMMKSDKVSVSIVLSAVFVASIVIVFIFGFLSDKNGIGSFYVNSEEEIKIPVVELFSTPARTHVSEARAFLSPEFTSKFNSTAIVTVSIFKSRSHISISPQSFSVCVIDGYRKAFLCTFV